MDREYNGDLFFMQAALREAQEAFDKDEVPIGAVVVNRGMIVARAHNLVETLTDCTAHAEMQALTAAMHASGGKYLTDCILYVTVEPCPMCAGALGWSQIGRVVYGAPDPKRGYTKLSGQILHPRTEITGGVLAEECTALMKKFFEKLR